MVTIECGVGEGPNSSPIGTYSYPCVLFIHSTLTYDCTFCSSGVTIGFEQTSYTVEEGLVVEVCVLVTSGTLQRDATVILSSINNEAVGKRRASTNYVHVWCQVIIPLH